VLTLLALATTLVTAGLAGLRHRDMTTPAPKRRRLRSVALVVALAAVIGGGTAVVLQKWGSGGGGSSVSSAPPSTPAAPKESATEQAEVDVSGVPSSWKKVDDPLGFSMYLPEGWQRKVVGEEVEGLQQVDYSPDGGEHFVRVSVDTSPDFATAHDHFVDLEQQVKDRLIGYRLGYLKENLYRDRAGSLWEYTWDAQPKDTPFPGPRRAIDQGYIDRDGTEYAIYMSSPQKDWAEAREQFSAVLRGWRTGS
ncbi:serine/threonine protein kinase, partial [Streptomyces nigra]